MIEGEDLTNVPVLRNPRHERFSQLVAGGTSLTIAFVSVGFSRTNAASGASRLSKTGAVRARIEELQNNYAARGAERAEITRAAVLRGLWAIGENKGEPASARVRALELCGKECGMFGDRTFSEWNGDVDQLSPAQREGLANSLAREVFGDNPVAIEAARRQVLLEAGLIIDIEPATDVKEPEKPIDRT